MPENPVRASRSVVIVGGTSGIGRELARYLAGTGDDVVLTGRDAERAALVAEEAGAGAAGSVRGLGVELTRPRGIAKALADIDRVDHLILAAIDRDQNTVAQYEPEDALSLVTLKLVGGTEVIHTLLPRFSRDGSIVFFGGRAKDRPYPGSTTVATVNAAVGGMVNALALELAPIRVNAVHPGIVGDSPFWRGKNLEGFISRTPTGRLATMADVVDAVAFLLRNPAMNGVNLNVDGGWLLT